MSSGATGVVAAVNTSPTGAVTISGTPAKGQTLTASNTLADVAIYFYDNDLRTAALGNCSGEGGKDVCANNVPVVEGSRDSAKHQHLTTFTMSRLPKKW